MRLDGLLPPERTLHHKQVNARREISEPVRIACVRSVAERSTGRLRQTQGKALVRVRCLEGAGREFRQRLEMFHRAHFVKLQGERLFCQTIVARAVKALEKFFQSAWAVDC